MTALHLTCCPTGRNISVHWIQDGKVWRTLPAGLSVHVAEADWVLVKVRDLFDGSWQTAVPVKFCPGCGTQVPTLRIREDLSQFHVVEPDSDGTCQACGTRYCDGDSPSHCFEAVVPEVTKT